MTLTVLAELETRSTCPAIVVSAKDARKSTRYVGIYQGWYVAMLSGAVSRATTNAKAGRRGSHDKETL